MQSHGHHQGEYVSSREVTVLISENYHVDIIFMYSKGDNRLILVNYLILGIMLQQYSVQHCITHCVHSSMRHVAQSQMNITHS